MEQAVTNPGFARQVAAALQTHLSPGLVCSATRHGLMLHLANDEFVGRSLSVYGEWVQAEVDLFARFVKPGMTVVDAGANIGAFTLPLARMTGSAGIVHAFEPQRALFQMLNANMILNGQMQVRAHHCGLGAGISTLKLEAADYRTSEIINYAGLGLAADNTGEEIDVWPLDRFRLPELHFMKIDVEGMEGLLLEGAERTIAFHQPIMFVENDQLDKSPALIRQIWNMGYRVWWAISLPFNPANFNGETQSCYGLGTSNNLLCVPRGMNFEYERPEITDADQTWKDIVEGVLDRYVAERNSK